MDKTKCSRDLNLLIPEMKSKVLNVVENCELYGVNLLVYCTLRPLEVQAKLWRQSRTSNYIEEHGINKLEKLGLDFLAKILKDVGPQYGKNGRHVTGALPGQSWHNYGMAIDAVPIVDGQAHWKTTHPDWKTYGKYSEYVGLCWGGNWNHFKDYPHSQLHKQHNPFKVYSPNQIFKICQELNLI
jgi:peptidoglycan LD-endopeptidase CwlK